LYKDNDEQVWPLTGDSLVTLGSKLVLPVTKLLLDKDYDSFCDSAMPSLCENFEYMRCDESGDSLYQISTPTFPESMADYPELYQDEVKDEQGILNAACRKYGADNVYFFNYDWRLDPLEHADSLNTLIEHIKQVKNCDKVNLACCSMGGTVTMSYIYKYGSDSINNLMLLSTAFQGVKAVGDMFSGELYIDKDALMRRIVNLGKGDLKEFIFEALMYALDKSGVAQGVSDIANSVLDKISDRLYDEFLTELFGTMPGIWDLTAAEDYEKAKAFMLDESANAILIKRVDEYIYNVQSKAKELLDFAVSNGTRVYIVCQYNMQSLPVSENCDMNNDLLIDVKFASGGAVCADLGETLGDNYIQAVADSHNHLSADSVIDASTCMYPESTWFIKDQAHVDYNVGPTTDFIFWLASSDTQLTVFDSEVYTQFMLYDYDDNTLIQITQGYAEKPDLFYTLVDIIQKVSGFIKTIVVKILDIIIKESM
ncbi:MAG: esterase/lipase family protein, partial [Acutalibacteraceae bacterium]